MLVRELGTREIPLCSKCVVHNSPLRSKRGRKPPTLSLLEPRKPYLSSQEVSHGEIPPTSPSNNSDLIHGSHLVMG